MESNLAETLLYIIARSEAKQNERNDIAEIIRWHGFVLARHFGNKNIRTPKDLFKLPNEMDVNLSEMKGGKYEPTEADLALKERMRLAAISYQKNKK